MARKKVLFKKWQPAEPITCLYLATTGFNYKI